MLSSNGLVSVILPIYNARSTLDQALDSLQTQTHTQLEIICVNDGSTDDSLQIMRAHAAADERIHIIDKQNEGYGASMNRGIDEAHGEWIAVLEPDDWVLPDMYASMLEFASGFEDGVDIIKTPYWRICQPDTPQQKRLNCSYKLRVSQSKEPGALHDVLLLLHHHPSIWSALYRKSFLDEQSIRFLPIPGAGWADNPFFMETLCKARSIVYLDQAFYCYREESDPAAAAFPGQGVLIPFERWGQMLDIIEETGNDTDDVLRAHYRRGFTYMSGVIEQVPLEDNPDVREALVQMFARMKPELVFGNPRISPGCQRLFAELRGLPAPKGGKLGYAGNLVEQTFFNWRTYGIGEAISNVRSFLGTYKRRTGAR